MNQTVNNQLTPLKFKIGQALSNGGNNIIILLNSYFLLYVYTDVIKIPAAAASVILLVARVWDAVNDPMMGAIVDKTKSKEGKCRFWIKYFSVPAAVITVLSYWCPEMAQPAKIAWVAITYILQGMFLTVLGVSSNTLIVRATDNSQERVKIQQMESLLSTINNAAIPAITLPLVKVTGHGNLALGFAVTVAIYAFINTACKLFSYTTSAGFDNDPLPAVSSDGEQVLESVEQPSALKLFTEALKNRYAVAICLIYIFYLLIASAMGASMVYYAQYTIKNMQLLSVYSTAGALGGFLGIAVMAPMSKKFGNARSCGICALIFAIGQLVRFFTHDSSMIVFGILVFFVAGASLNIGAFSIQCIMDACTYGRLTTGVNNQAVTMSFFTFGMKAGQAIGGAVVAALISLVPYVPQAEEQAESVKALFFAENVTIPMVLAIFLFLGFFFIVDRYEKKLKTLKKELEANDAAANIAAVE